jgi:carbon monoxide dehydrogenase subunit G
MKLHGNLHIQAERALVFERFTNAGFVAQCIPDVQYVQTVEEGRRYNVVIAIGFGAAKSTFESQIEFLEKTPSDSARIKAHGRAPGSLADVSAMLALRDGPNGSTEVEWSADIEITGAVASVAMRMLDSLTRTMSAQFFECAKARIEQPAACG